MNELDYYAILGIPREATDQEIKKAYRRQAIKYHPDKNPGDQQAEEQFKVAAEAYNVLGDPEKRSLYDRYGQAGLGGNRFRGFDSDIFGDFEDILGNLFGLGGLFGQRGTRPRTAARSGADLRFDLEIDFEESVTGTDTSIHVARMEPCADCRGSGANPPGAMEGCPRCGGSGSLHMQQGFFTLSRTCQQCQGTGKFVRDPCKACSGSGRVRAEKKIRVKIPAGVDSDSHLRLAGEGEGGIRGGPAGDLYVVLHVRPHDFFQRQGNDLNCQVSITFTQAALGHSLAIPTFEGKEKVTIPPGTQSGTVFRVRGRGVSEISSSRKGDLFVTVQVVTPKRLNRQQRRLLEELAEMEEAAGSRPKDFMGKVKDLFP